MNGSVAPNSSPNSTLDPKSVSNSTAQGPGGNETQPQGNASSGSSSSTANMCKNPADIKDPDYCIPNVNNKIQEKMPDGRTWETITCAELCSASGADALQNLQAYPECCGGTAMLRCLKADGNCTGASIAPSAAANSTLSHNAGNFSISRCTARNCSCSAAGLPVTISPWEADCGCRCLVEGAVSSAGAAQEP